MENFNKEALEITIREHGSRVFMSWLGQSDDKNPSESLSPYLIGITDTLTGKDLIIDFHELSYMNSSTVPPIIQFLKALHTKKITTRIVYNSQSKWQCASFKALESLSSMMRNLTVTGK